MELDATIEPTIGPYEVYEDEWFNYKAAFEAFITVKDQTESQKLQKFAGSLQEIENNLPIDPKYRNPKLGALAPIAVVNTVFSAGDGNRGVQTAAFNLPNDERVIREKGSKRVMLKNNQEAKFSKVLMPISRVALAAARSGERRVRRVLHPHPDARADARPRPARHHRRRPRDDGAPGAEGHLQRHRGSQGRHLRACSRCSSWSTRAARQGARADDVHDVSGVGVPVDPLRHQRSARPRPGDSAELPAGSRRLQGQRRRDVCGGSRRRSATAVVALTREIMTLQAEGSYAKAKAMIDTLGVIRPETKRVLDRLTDVPVDIEPRFTTAEQLLRRDRRDQLPRLAARWRPLRPGADFRLGPPSLCDGIALAQPEIVTGVSPSAVGGDWPMTCRSPSFDPEPRFDREPVQRRHDCGADREHRHSRLRSTFGRRAEDNVCSFQPLRAHHDQICRTFVDLLKDLLGRLADRDRDADRLLAMPGATRASSS